MVEFGDCLNTDILLRTVSYLPYQTVQHLREVNRFWNSTVRKTYSLCVHVMVSALLVSDRIIGNESSRFSCLQAAVDKCLDYSTIVVLVGFSKLLLY